MTTYTLIPETETCNSAEPNSFKDSESTIGQSTCEVAGEIIRKTTLLNEVRNETQLFRKDISKTSTPDAPHVNKPLIRLPGGTLPMVRVKVLQQWEGVVTDTTSDSFYAELQDLGNSSVPLEFVEIPFDEVPGDDQPLLVEGAVFYWSIGYKTSPGGQLERVSEIRLRRTPRWTKRAIEQATKRAEELFERHAEK